MPLTNIISALLYNLYSNIELIMLLQTKTIQVLRLQTTSVLRPGHEDLELGCDALYTIRGEGGDSFTPV